MRPVFLTFFGPIGRGGPEITVSDAWLRWYVVYRRNRLSAQLRSDSARDRLAAARMIGFGRDDWARPLLREALGDRWALVRWTAARALASFQGNGTEVTQGLGSQDAVVQAAEADALAPGYEGDVMAALAPLLDAPSLSARQAAVEAVGRVAGLSWSQRLMAIARADDEQISVRRAAIRAVCEMYARERRQAGDDEAGALVLVLDDASPVIRADAAWAIGRLGLGACAHRLALALGDADAAVRWQAAGALARVGTGANLPALRGSLGDEEMVFGRAISARVREALVRLVLREFGERVRGWVTRVATAARLRRPSGSSSDEGQ